MKWFNWVGSEERDRFWLVPLFLGFYHCRLLPRLLLVLAALPAIYLFCAIQRGAITVPFWDHAELISIIATWYDGTFHVASLFAPQNQARPVVYRVVMGLNALMTDWDVRSEFTYIYFAFYGLIAIHAWALHRVTASRPPYDIVFPTALLLTSLIVCSPVGHNDQWWSLMFILDGANLFIALGMLTVFMRPQSLPAHMVAAVICWVAAYSFANGIFAVFAVGSAFQLSSERLMCPSRPALFWAANLAVLLACYLPGIVVSSPHHPSALQLAQFFITFLGAPFGGLLSFPYHSMTDLPASITFNALCGAVLVASSLFLCWHGRGRLRSQHSAALILFGFTIFAMVSAIVTGWGRADFNQSTISNANASRYTIFAAYLILGQIYYVAAGLSEGWWKNRLLGPAMGLGVLTFVVLAALSYDNAFKIYNNTHDFNKKVVDAYTWGLQPTPADMFIYPNPNFVIQVKRDLQRLELGPYNDRQYDSLALPVGKIQSVFVLSDSSEILQNFIAAKDGLKDVSVEIERPNKLRAAGVFVWQINEVSSGQKIAAGTLDASRIHSKQIMRLKLPYLADSDGREYCISFAGNANAAHALAIALYAPGTGSTSPSITISKPQVKSKTENFSMALVMDYAD